VKKSNVLRDQDFSCSHAVLTMTCCLWISNSFFTPWQNI